MNKIRPIATNWFEIDEADEFGVRRITEPHVPQYRGGSIWLVEGSARSLLVETGVGVAPLRSFVETVTDRPIMAFASVGYYDHAGGLHQFEERLIHADDAERVSHPNRHNTVADYYFDEEAFTALPTEGFDPLAYTMPPSKPTRLLADGDVIDLGDREFEVLHLPGVTAGASALYERKTGVIFTGEAFVWRGDYVYDGEPSDRSDDADRMAFRASIERLADLPVSAAYPGHYGRSDGESMKAAIASYLRR